MLIQNFNTREKIFLIAEIGNNHEGSIKLAKKLIYLAKKNGADAVKFQYINPKKLVNYKIYPDRVKFLKKICLSLSQLKELRIYAKKVGIIFFFSIFDYTNINNLSKMVPAFKIASGDNNIVSFINNLLKFKKPILFSSGMLTNREIKKIISQVKINKKKLSNKLCVMHCVSNYPVKFDDINMLKINFLKKLNVTVGYSDHSMGIQSCIVAAALGAKIIEKHFTIDHNYSDFRDHKLSMNPKQLKELSSCLNDVTKILGQDINAIPKTEEKNIKNNRRGIYASRNLKKNQEIQSKDIILLRPQGKISADNLNQIRGRKVNRNISKLEELNLNNVY